jgi:hypothetical protein
LLVALEVKLKHQVLDPYHGKEKEELEVAEVNLATHQLEKVNLLLKTLKVGYIMEEPILEEELLLEELGVLEL